MINVKIKLIQLILLVFVLILPDIVSAQGENLLPLPKNIEKLNGAFVMVKDETIIHFADVDTSKLQICRKQLNLIIAKYFTVKSKNERKIRTIWMGIPARDQRFKELCLRYGISLSDSLGREGYVLRVADDALIIAAQYEAGLFYGVQTLKQLIRNYADKHNIPAMEISDWPDFSFRGVHNDISRGPVPTLEYMKEQIRRFAELKLNVVSYYTENIVATKSHGDFAPAHGSITIDQWKELDKYAQKYFIRLIANFQSFAHFEKILAYPQYESLGATERLLSPVNPEAFKLLQDVYSEMAPAFHSPYFMVNGDETWDLERGTLKEYTDSLGVAKVYADFMIKLQNELKKYNKRMIMWADVAMQHPEILDLLPKDIIMTAWNYGVHDSYSAFINPITSKGFETLVSPGILNSRRLMPDYNIVIANIRGLIRAGLQEKALGVLNTVWDDDGDALFSRDWYGIACGADQSWNVNNQSLNDFNRRFSLAFYNDKSDKFMQSIRQLMKLSEIAPTQGMNYAVFKDKIIPALGKKTFINRAEWLSVKITADSAAMFLKKAEARINAQDLRALHLTVGQYQFMADSRLNSLSAAENYKNACLLQKENRKRTEKELLKSLNKIDDICIRIIELKTEARECWLMENKTYWLKHYLEPYDEQLSMFERVKTNLAEAINDFNAGYYLPPPNEIGLSIEEIRGQYFTDWLLCGPFTNIKNAGRKQDYLKNAGGESGINPREGDACLSQDGSNKKWITFHSPQNAVIDLNAVYSKNKEVIAYAFCIIESKRQRSVKASFGSNDGIQVFLNGEIIFDKSVKRSIQVDEEGVNLHLKKGLNHILLKIDQNKGGWGFSFRLPDVEIRHQDYRYTILD